MSAPMSANTKMALYTGAAAAAGASFMFGAPMQTAGMMGATAAGAVLAADYVLGKYPQDAPMQPLMKTALFGAAIEGAWVATGQMPGVSVQSVGLAMGSAYLGHMLGSSQGPAF